MGGGSSLSPKRSAPMPKLSFLAQLTGRAKAASNEGEHFFLFQQVHLISSRAIACVLVGFARSLEIVFALLLTFLRFTRRWR